MREHETAIEREKKLDARPDRRRLAKKLEITFCPRPPIVWRLFYAIATPYTPDEPPCSLATLFVWRLTGILEFACYG
ncbi:hypothetical protein KIN20_024763 [Parelaphostrongylus tenuis]|uniref:Uncharacterized protein n=1 Tax=Parelaphostrongylus tenuis TaxID=148309 RepID=A0AAD5QTW0_PARTN|nr:hypothetical protein KIN20_024763 [Parelaphostrongylus tenuis]